MGKLLIIILLILIIPNTTKATITDGLITYWSYDTADTTTGIVKSTSKDYYQWYTNTNNFSITPHAKIGQAGNYSGTNTSYTTVNTSLSYIVGGNFTMSFWLNPTVVGTILKNVMSFTDNDNNEIRIAVDFQGTRTALEIYLKNGSVIKNDGCDGVLTQSTWQLITIEKENNVINISVNNAKKSWSGLGLAGGCFIGTTQTSMIGKCVQNNAVNEGTILIDDFGIWNRILTTEEKDYIYNSGNGRNITSITLTYDNLTVNYNLTEKEGYETEPITYTYENTYNYSMYSSITKNVYYNDNTYNCITTNTVYGNEADGTQEFKTETTKCVITFPVTTALTNYQKNNKLQRNCNRKQQLNKNNNKQ